MASWWKNLAGMWAAPLHGRGPELREGRKHGQVGRVGGFIPLCSGCGCFKFLPQLPLSDGLYPGIRSRINSPFPLVASPRVSFITEIDVKPGVKRIVVFVCFIFYASLYSFSYLILCSPSKVGMAIFALKIKKKCQNYKVTEVAWSERKAHESLAESLASPETQFVDDQLEPRQAVSACPGEPAVPSSAPRWRSRLSFQATPGASAPRRLARTVCGFSASVSGKEEGF